LLNEEELRSVGVVNQVKLEYFPLAKGKILLRLDNLDDQFSSNLYYNLKDIPYVKVDELAKLILQKAIGDLPTSYSLTVKEMSLTANEEI
jgi:hypothetical protein